MCLCYFFNLISSVYVESMGHDRVCPGVYYCDGYGGNIEDGSRYSVGVGLVIWDC